MRVKQTIKEHGIEAFNEHQILEAMLFYSVANGDTNPAAHRLIERFGSFKEVIDADYDELCSVSGIGENSAVMINLIRMIISKYMMESCYDGRSMRFVSTEALRQYFEGFFIGCKEEKIYAVILDDDLVLLKHKVIAEGAINEVLAKARPIVDFVVKNGGNRVAIAHNHPNGSRMPSKDDIKVTCNIVRNLAGLDIDLVDHIIVGKDGAFSLRSSQHAATIWGS